MSKLTGKKKAAFLARMAKGRKKAKNCGPKKKKARHKKKRASHKKKTAHHHHAKKTHRKKTTHHHHAKKASRKKSSRKFSPGYFGHKKKTAFQHAHVSAAGILKGAVKRGNAHARARGGKMNFWACAGPVRSGCGGGKAGGHVVGSGRMVRATRVR